MTLIFHQQLLHLCCHLSTTLRFAIALSNFRLRYYGRRPMRKLTCPTDNTSPHRRLRAVPLTVPLMIDFSSHAGCPQLGALRRSHLSERASNRLAGRSPTICDRCNASTTVVPPSSFMASLDSRPRLMAAGVAARGPVAFVRRLYVLLNWLTGAKR
jgi:hypothetical protein